MKSKTDVNAAWQFENRHEESWTVAMVGICELLVQAVVLGPGCTLESLGACKTAVRASSFSDKSNTSSILHPPIDQIQISGGGTLTEILLNSFPGNSNVQSGLRNAGLSVTPRICDLWNDSICPYLISESKACLVKSLKANFLLFFVSIIGDSSEPLKSTVNIFKSVSFVLKYDRIQAASSRNGFYLPR